MFFLENPGLIITFPPQFISLTARLRHSQPETAFHRYSNFHRTMTLYRHSCDHYKVHHYQQMDFCGFYSSSLSFEPFNASGIIFGFQGFILEQKKMSMKKKRDHVKKIRKNKTFVFRWLTETCRSNINKFPSCEITAENYCKKSLKCSTRNARSCLELKLLYYILSVSVRHCNAVTKLQVAVEANKHKWHDINFPRKNCDKKVKWSISKTANHSPLDETFVFCVAKLKSHVVRWHFQFETSCHWFWSDFH